MKVIFAGENGVASILTPVIPEGCDDKEAELTRTIAKDIPVGVDYEIVKDEDIPTDRTFRNAWEKDSKAIKVDMPKARVIHMDHIRLARNERLGKTDIEMMIAGEQGKDTADLKKERQDLRDIPKDFDLSKAGTPDALKKLWPDLLT